MILLAPQYAVPQWSLLFSAPSGQDWWNVKGVVKNLPPNHLNDDPFKPNWRSPLRNLPSGDDPKFCRIDPAHTYAIDGIGKSFLGSSIVLLMHMGWFGNANIDIKFKNAYARFIAYCSARGKHTSITEFSYKSLKLPQNSCLERQLNNFCIIPQKCF